MLSEAENEMEQGAVKVLKSLGEKVGREGTHAADHPHHASLTREERLDAARGMFIEHFEAKLTQEGDYTALSQAQKLDRILKDLPPAIQAAIVQMTFYEPAISKCLTEAEGKTREIVDAVEAGWKAGQQMRPMKTVSVQIFGKHTGKLMGIKFKQIYDNPSVKAGDLPGVMSGFEPLAKGALGLSLIGDRTLGYFDDLEHHEHHLHEDEHEGHDHTHELQEKARHALERSHGMNTRY